MAQNRQAIAFISILALIYGFWFLLYHFVLLPDGRLDAFVAYNIVGVTAGLLQSFGYEVFVFDRVVATTFTNGIEVIDACTATEVLGLYAGFIVAYPGENWKKVYFIAIGFLLIYLVNVTRIFALVLVQVHYPQYWSISHDYTANTIFYVLILILWIVWAMIGEKGGRFSLDSFLNPIKPGSDSGLAKA